MKEPKDKRTKEHKEWKALQPEQLKETVGLGDVVEKITKATGIKKVVDAVAKKLDKDCGCDEKKEKWNKIPLFIKTKARRCFTDKHVLDYGFFIEQRKVNTWTLEDRRFLIDMFAHVFALQYNIKNFGGNCGGCAKTLKSMQEKLDKVCYEK
jgi:hypothetical protein